MWICEVVNRLVSWENHLQGVLKCHLKHIQYLSSLLQWEIDGDEDEQEPLHFTTIQSSFPFLWTLCFYMYFLPNIEGMINWCLRYVLYNMENMSIMCYDTNNPWFLKWHEQYMKRKIIYRLNMVMKAEEKILLEEKNILSADLEDVLNNSKSFWWCKYSQSNDEIISFLIVGKIFIPNICSEHWS